MVQGLPSGDVRLDYGRAGPFSCSHRPDAQPIHAPRRLQARRRATPTAVRDGLLRTRHGKFQECNDGAGGDARNGPICHRDTMVLACTRPGAFNQVSLKGQRPVPSGRAGSSGSGTSAGNGGPERAGPSRVTPARPNFPMPDQAQAMAAATMPSRDATGMCLLPLTDRRESRRRLGCHRQLPARTRRGCRRRLENPIRRPSGTPDADPPVPDQSAGRRPL